MRIVCNTVVDFLRNLELEGPEAVLQKAVRVSVSSVPLDENKREAVKFSVMLQASAVVCLPEGGEYLLEVGVDCGRDYKDDSHEYEGTRTATAARKRIEEFCEKHGLDVRPGVIDL